MHNSLAIKNLSIALDALGHVHGTEDHFERIKDLLMDEIRVAEEKPDREPVPLVRSTTADDDIPF